MSVIINGKVFDRCEMCMFSGIDRDYCVWKDETVDPKSIPLDCPYMASEIEKEREKRKEEEDGNNRLDY